MINKKDYKASLSLLEIQHNSILGLHDQFCHQNRFGISRINRNFIVPDNLRYEALHFKHCKLLPDAVPWTSTAIEDVFQDNGNKEKEANANSPKWQVAVGIKFP